MEYKDRSLSFLPPLPSLENRQVCLPGCSFYRHHHFRRRVVYQARPSLPLVIIITCINTIIYVHVVQESGWCMQVVLMHAIISTHRRKSL